MAQYYAERAPAYDAVYAKPERQSDLQALRTLIADRVLGRSVYEMASGTGYWTEVMAPHAREIFAVDCNAEVQEIARLRPLAGQKAIHALGDAFQPPPAPFACDLGFAGFWWSHLRHAEKHAFLSSFRSALVPGASLLLIDNRYVEGSSTPISRTDSEGNTFQLRPLPQGGHYEVVKNFPTEAEFREEMGALFSEIQWYPLHHYWMAYARFLP